MSVPMVPLGDLMLGRTSSTDPARFPSEMFTLYSIPAFDAGAPERQYGRNIGSAKKNLEPDDVLLSRIVPHIRRSWIVGRHEGTRIIGSGEWIIFRSSRVDGSYLRHFLTGDPFHSQFMQTVVGVGGSLLRANPHQVAELAIPMPPLAEQRRIAATLDKADALRRKRKCAIALLDGLTQSIFLEMFGERIFNASESCLQQIGRIADLQNGVYYPAEQYTDSQTGVEMVHMSDAFYGTVKRGNLKKVIAKDSDIKKYCLLNSDLLVARRSLNVEGAAKPCLIPASQEPLIYESSFIRIRCDPGVLNSVYLYQYLSNSFVRQKHLNPYITQSTISGINQSNLNKVHVFIPSIAEQKTFVSAVSEVERVRNKMINQSDVSNIFFSSLQHRAFTGQL